MHYILYTMYKADTLRPAVHGSEGSAAAGKVPQVTGRAKSPALLTGRWQVKEISCSLACWTSVQGRQARRPFIGMYKPSSLVKKVSSAKHLGTVNEIVARPVEVASEAWQVVASEKDQPTVSTAN